MKDFFFAAARVEEYLRSKNWRFCFIGGTALQRWGELEGLRLEFGEGG